ncbi:unnamed protein product [Phytomonas sp. EM1]|nr:unnamed protein product [Phytomonas sp. EM1]|eukprot:CCW62653.1 unnamed protein product [Phytomonas sp. isolate EM1]
MANDYVGQLLSEYLRVINEKDNEIQKLIKGMEDLRISHKKCDDKFKTKLNFLKSEIHERSTTEMQLKNRIAESEVVMSEFLSQSETLKNDLQAKDKELQEVSGRLSTECNKLQKEVREHIETIAELKHQIEECNIELKEAAIRQQDLEKGKSAHHATISVLQDKVRLSEDTICDLNGTVALLQNRLQDSISRQEHERCVAQVEAKSTENTTKHERITTALNQQLHTMEEETKELKNALNQYRQSLQEAAAQRESSDKVVSELRQQHQEREHLLEMTRREAQSWKESCAKATDIQAEMGRTIASKDDQLRRTVETLQETRLTLERVKVQADATEKSIQMQLNSMCEKSKQYQEEIERYRRQLESKENALREATAALGTLKDNVSLTTSNLRDQLAITNASASACKEENERLRQELKQEQLKRQETQHTLSQEVAALRSKIEEYQAAAQTSWQRLRDKEEEIRRLELVHDKALKERKYEHESAMESMCRSKDAEIQDTLSRLERCRAELLDHSGGNKGLSQNLERYAERTRQLMEELSCAKSSLVSKNETIEELKRNLEVANGKLVQQEQRITIHLQEEAQLRRRLEAGERDLEAVRSDLIHSEAAVAERDSTVRRLEETINKTQGNEQAQEARIQTLHRQIAEQQEAEQLSRKELASREIQIDKLKDRLERSEAEIIEVQVALKQARQNTEASQNALKAAEEETLRLKGDLNNCSTEFKRTVKHAEEIEELARKKTEELRQAIESRDEMITTLQKERAIILPHLNKEQSKNLVLQEKLQHHKELEQLTAVGLRERVADLEAALHSKEMEVEAAKGLNTDTQRRVDELQAQLWGLQEASESREKKHIVCKEELRKALAALEKEKVSANSQAERLESEVASANALRRKFKKEKSRMEASLKELEEKVNLATRAEKASQHRESALLKDLQAAEAALEASKVQTQRAIDAQRELYRDTAHNATMVEQKCADLELQLKLARENAASTRSTCDELQRRLTNSYTRSAEYSEEAIAMKIAFSELLMQLYRETMQQMKRHLHSSWIVCQHAKHEYEVRARDLAEQMTLQLEKTKTDHDLAMDAELNRHRVEIARLMEQHRAELVESRQAVSEKAYESRREKEVASCALQEKEEALHAATVELECARVDAVHLRKQLRLLQEQRDAAEVRGSELQQKLDEVYRTQRRENDALQRKLNDSTAEHRHNEDEMRELRAEITALQQLMSEQRKLISEERAEFAAVSERLQRVQEARDGAVAQLKDLKSQVAAAKANLERMRESHQLTLGSVQQAHQADKDRIGKLQEQLSASNAELQRLQCHAVTQRDRIDSIEGELRTARAAEAELLARVQSLSSGISALREKCANLESLKNISDVAFAEAQQRERNLMAKLEELRNSQQLMQVCFDKQQEQLEVGRRLREQRSE